MCGPGCFRGFVPALLSLTAALSLQGAVARAATGAGPAAPGAAPRPLDPLRQLAERLSRESKVRVMVDPAVHATSLREIPADDLPVERALDLALAAHRRLAWRRVQLPAGPEEIPPVEALAAAARAVGQPGMGSMVIEDPKSGQLAVCLKDQPLSQPAEGTRKTPRPGPALSYLIYSTVAPPGGVDLSTQYVDLQQQQLALPVEPAQGARAMMQVAQLLASLPPAEMQAFASRTLQAGLPLWESTPPEQRQELIQQALQMMKAFDAGLQREAAGQPAPRRPVPAPRATRGDPRALAAALLDRYRVTAVVDPVLSAASPALLPGPDVPLDEALVQVAAALPGSAWRRVYLTDAQRQRRPSAEKLAGWVRALERLEVDRLVLQEPAAHRETILRKGEPAAGLAAARGQGGLAERPLYLLISATPSARGDTAEERRSDLQRQQIALMLRLSPEQMMQSMAQVIRAFPSADAATRARLLALPAMAGLMAAWMPQTAKERGEPLAP